MTLKHLPFINIFLASERFLVRISTAALLGAHTRILSGCLISVPYSSCTTKFVISRDLPVPGGPSTRLINGWPEISRWYTVCSVVIWSWLRLFYEPVNLLNFIFEWCGQQTYKTVVFKRLVIWLKAIVLRIQYVIDQRWVF